MSAPSGSVVGGILSSAATPLTVLFWTAVVCVHHATDAAADAASSNGTNAGNAEGRSGGGFGGSISWSLIKDTLQGTAVRAVEGGPENLQPIDLLFCGVLIVMALELLSFLIKRSGSKCEGRSHLLDYRSVVLEWFSIIDSGSEASLVSLQMHGASHATFNFRSLLSFVLFSLSLVPQQAHTCPWKAPGRTECKGSAIYRNESDSHGTVRLLSPEVSVSRAQRRMGPAKDDRHERPPPDTHHLCYL